AGLVDLSRDRRRARTRIHVVVSASEGERAAQGRRRYGTADEHEVSRAKNLRAEISGADRENFVGSGRAAGAAEIECDVSDSGLGRTSARKNGIAEGARWLVRDVDRDIASVTVLSQVACLGEDIATLRDRDVEGAVCSRQRVRAAGVGKAEISLRESLGRLGTGVGQPIGDRPAE